MPIAEPATNSRETRPNTQVFLQLDRKNPYAELGVSPLAPSAEISTRIDTELAEARRRFLAKGTSKSDDPDALEMLRLQHIDELIGDPRRRKAYDEEHPQNILLTVQPSALEQAWSRYRRAGLISQWVYEALEGDACETESVASRSCFVPTFHCLRLWAPAGLDAATIEFLEPFERAPQQAEVDLPEAQAVRDETSTVLTITDLETILGKE